MGNKLFVALVFFFAFKAVMAQNGLNVISSGSSEIVLEYHPQYENFTKTKSGFYSVDVTGADINGNDFGLPTIPSISFELGVPNFGSTIKIINANYEKLAGKLKPIKPWEQIDSKSQVEIKSNKYKTFANESWINIENKGIIRGVKSETFKIYPILFNASKSEIKKLKSLRFKIIYRQGGTFSKINDEFLSGVLINYKTAKNWGIHNRKLSKTIQNSVLASGVWHRVNITEEGIYKIDYAQLVSLGFDPNSDNPRTIKIYNNGGENLQEGVTAPRPNDLVENNIIFKGESDGKLDPGDYLLFYGHGSDFFIYNNQYRKGVREHNWFTKKNYYWITWGGSNGKRVPFTNTQIIADAFQQNTTKSFLYHEKDLFNVIKSGRLFLGESFSYSQRTLTFNNPLPNLVPGSTIDYNYAVANLSSPSVYFTIEESGNTIISTNLRGYGSGSYVFGKYIHNSVSYSGTLPSNNSSLKFTFEANSTDKNGALDYFEISYDSYLKASDDFLLFFSKDTNSAVRFNLSGFSSSDISILDVSDYANITGIIPNTDNNGNANFYAQLQTADVHKYVAFTPAAAKSVSGFEAVPNSNIRGNIPNTKFVVIANRSMEQDAGKLVDYVNNDSPNSISTSLFFTDDIYNEFSCGLLDPAAIRDFIRYLYLNSTVAPEYVLLYGNGSYDYFDTEEKHNNFVPMLESMESLYEVNSYFTDDYYARVDGNDSKIDLAIARLPIENSQEADTYFQKYVDYENNSDFSEWRSRITLLADDGLTSHGDDGNEHTYRSEVLSSQLPQYFEQDKIYLIQYPTVITGLGRRKPLVNQAIINALNNGTLIFNFYGHGNPDVLTHERVFISDVTVPQLVNNNYFFLTAATCDFGRCDDPMKKSGVEKMLLKPDGGAIGSFASNRPVYSSSNAALNQDFYHYLLNNRDSLGLPKRIGYALFRAKALNASPNTEKFSLLSIPILRLKEPQKTAQIDSINGISVTTEPVPIKALGNVSLDGKVNSSDSFTGEALITVYDSKRSVEIPEWNYTIYEQGGILYRGRASVVNGNFITNFVVPKDISFGENNGKITAYFFNDEVDGIGGTDLVKITGIDTSRHNDGAGPAINIYYDNLANQNGYLVNPDFTFYAKLEDETGINTSGLGLGHKLEGIINGDEENPIDFTNYFVGDLDEGGKSGEVKYNFYNYKPGDYSIVVKAWDVFNNSSQKESHFTVVSGDEIAVRNIVNFPNPFKGSTFFTFQHNLSEPINVKINIYTVYGRKIKSVQEYGITDKFVKIYWDGLDEDGDKPANGAYLYRIVIESASGKYSKTFDGKLAIIR